MYNLHKHLAQCNVIPVITLLFNSGFVSALTRHQGQWDMYRHKARSWKILVNIYRRRFVGYISTVVANCTWIMRYIYATNDEAN